MNPEEYQNLVRIEQHHWFYAGKRQLVQTWIQRLHPLQTTDLLVDCGAGTGLFAEEMRTHCHVLAVDDHGESLRLLRTRLGAHCVLAGSCTSLPLADNSVNVLTALDVLEHVPDDLAAVREFGRVLRPGGLAVVTVPALMALWSDWDVTLHHQRRYNATALRKIIAPHFEVIHLNYVNVAVLPAVFGIRKYRALMRRCGFKIEGRSEDRIPPAWLNRWLQSLFVGLACQRRVQFPAGVGLLAVVRKPSAINRDRPSVI